MEIFEKDLVKIYRDTLIIAIINVYLSSLFMYDIN